MKSIFCSICLNTVRDTKISCPFSNLSLKLKASTGFVPKTICNVKFSVKSLPIFFSVQAICARRIRGNFFYIYFFEEDTRIKVLININILNEILSNSSIKNTRVEVRRKGCAVNVLSGKTGFS